MGINGLLDQIDDLGRIGRTLIDRLRKVNPWHPLLKQVDQDYKITNEFATEQFPGRNYCVASIPLGSMPRAMSYYIYQLREAVQKHES